ncbi:MAG TPA: aspartate aminotransferase family protein [Candidatus Sulfomarinibacteraceae bacterium]|nr:aspartate aminotransferase family protein [Candidatus Sulfomarinibacteraceae bacterium]
MSEHPVVRDEASYLVPTYARPEVVFERGQGVYLYDNDGRRYLDFMAGIAVNALGHADAQWVKVVSEQAARLTHVSNLYHTAPHVELAQRLVQSSFADRVFFCNSGSEANETALKFARKYARRVSERDDKTKIVAFTGSFHGRTMGALSATYKSKYRDPFGPLIPHVAFAPYNDSEAAERLIDGNTCAVIVEPIQGEGGVNPATSDFLNTLRTSCDEHDALLIFDEVQCGLGRSGHLWAHLAYNVEPDIMTLAKPLAGGLPIGATLVREDVALVMEPGDHGSTFAAGPLVCRAAQVVFDRVNDSAFLDDVRQKGEHLRLCLRQLDSSLIDEVRGQGLLIGLQFSMPVKRLMSEARQRGLLIINAGEDVIRICPPLTITREEIEEGVTIFGETLSAVEASI